MKNAALLTLLAVLTLTLAATGCSTAEQRARFRSRADDSPRIITHQDRESNLHN